MRVIALAGLVGVIVGCGAPPVLRPEAEVARLGGMTDGVVFQTQGGAVDAGAVGERLTMASAVERAVRESPEVQGAIARFRGALAGAKQARLLPNPVLSVAVRFPSGGGKPVVEAGLTEELVGLLRKPGEIRVADAQLRAAATEVETVALDVIAETQEKMVGVSAGDALVVAIEGRREVLSRLLKVTRDRVGAGEGTRLDMLSLEAERLEVEAELADARLEAREARLALARRLGVPSSEAKWEVEGLAGEEKRSAIADPTGERELVSGALEGRPEVRGQVFRLAALGAEVDLARWAVWEGGEVGVDSEREDGEWSVGPAVGGSVPVFDWGGARREGARAAVVEARHKLTEIRRGIVEEVRRAWAAREAAEENLRRVEGELVPLAGRRLEQARVQFQGGGTDSTALLAAEGQARAAEVKVVELRRRRDEASVRLARAVGMGVLKSDVKSEVEGVK